MAAPVDDLARDLSSVRAHTLALVEGLDDAVLRAQPTPDWSPLGWHLGHIGFTEARWLLERAHGEDDLTRPYAGVFAQEESEKARRGRTIPTGGAILAYLDAVRARVLDRLHDTDPPLLRLVIGHERQHAEILAVVLQRLGPPARPVPWACLPAPTSQMPEDAWRHPIDVSSGTFRIGDDDDPWAYDNERPARQVKIRSFRLARTPVTCGAWRAFIEDGGYRAKALWSEAGWAWRTACGIDRPAAWREDEMLATPVRTLPFDPRLPVHGISLHEARAFARWAGARLPTEEERHVAAFAGEASHTAPRAGKAMRADDGRATGTTTPRYPWGDAPPDPTRCNAQLWYGGPIPVGALAGESLLQGARADEPPRGLTDLGGQVWEWTDSPFAPHPGFEPGPYGGYSAPYFDGAHYVLKGGSFASVGGVLRCGFRNWYPAASRDLFSGVRLAWDGFDD